MFAKPKINGVIAYMRLEDFWNDLSPDQQNNLIRYWRMRLGARPDSSPIEGDVEWSTIKPLQYLFCLIKWSDTDHDWELSRKVIEWGEKVILERETDLIDQHFFFQCAAESYYKQREIADSFIDLCIDYCIRDIKLFKTYAKPLEEFCGCMPRIITFQRIAIIYEKQKEYSKAIKISNEALQHGLTDGTKGGYAGRIERLEKKLAAQK